MKSDRVSNGVYLVGAGPGEPELITVKGLRLIKSADVIIYDFLVNKKLLAFARKGAELICVGKSHIYHSMEQEKINELLVEKAGEAKTVIRLKNGDPFMFGRGAEEAVYLAERNIPCYVVPGVSSAIAVPASCGVPLTHRDYASSVGITTGHRKDDEAVKSVNADTLVFLMTVGNLKRITGNLIRSGKQPDTPCILIERGTLDSQKTVRGNLKNIARKSRVEGINPPAVLVVGEVVRLAKPRILFTGTNPQKFRSLGEILHQPMIRIVPLSDYSKVKREIKRIDKYDWIIFTSCYGVQYFFEVSIQRNKMKKRIKRIKICAIGRTTADKLEEYDMRVDCIPEKESSRGIIDALKNFDLKGKDVLMPCSNLSGDYLSGGLRKMGASVKTIRVYKNLKPSKFKKINLGEIDEIIFTSPSTVRNFISKYKDIPERIKLKCIGDVTCAALKSYGFSGKIMK